VISVEEFNKMFKERHDFIYSDRYFLDKKYKYIKFLEIPEAWVYSIDKHLSKLRQPRKVITVSQILGLLVIEKDDSMLISDKNILKSLDKNLRDLDIDLYEQLEEGIILN
jgi:hypothetical protein